MSKVVSNMKKPGVKGSGSSSKIGISKGGKTTGKGKGSSSKNKNSNSKSKGGGVDYNSGVIGPAKDVGDILIWHGNDTTKGGEATSTNNAQPAYNPLENNDGYSTDGYGTTQTPSFDRLRQQYQNDMNSLYNTRVNYLAGVRDRAIGDARTKYAGLANNAYIAYRQNMAKRRSMASNLGMTGGAVENLRVGDENNYSTSLSNVNSGRNTAYTNARNAYSDAENNARVNRDTAIANNQAELSQAEIAYNQSQKQFDAQQAAQQTQWRTENMQRANELKQAQDEADKTRQTNYDIAKTLNKLDKKIDKIQNKNNKSKSNNSSKSNKSSSSKSKSKSKK